jgi:putative hydrolase of the HAD superfamily
MAPKVLLVDLDGVIRHWRQPDTPIEIAHGLPTGSIKKAAFASNQLWPAITGQISDKEWRSRVAAYLGATYRVPTAAQAIKQWSEQPVEVDQRVLSLLRLCESVARIVLVTNATSRLASDLQSMGIASHFSAVINSSEVGVAKPEAGFFQTALSRVQATPGQALLIDDTLANVEAAENLGITAHRFVGYTELSSFLQESGVLHEPAL